MKKRIFRRLTAAGLSAVMILCGCSGAAAAFNGETSLQDFKASAAAAQESDEVVMIYTEEDLIAFSEKVSSGESPDAELCADIVADSGDFEPIGGAMGVTSSSTYPSAYTGTFDGNGYTITVLLENGTSNYYTALFGGLGEGGLIRDLHVAGTAYGGYYSAGVVAYATGGTIENVTSSVTVTTTNKMYAGGIVAYNASGTLNIIGCRNTGTVKSGSTYCGGILAYTKTAAQIIGCVNSGAVTADTTYAGGIAAYVAGSDTQISSCINTGAVSGTYHVGGIVGYLTAGSVQYCGNEGTVTGSGGSSYGAGGVAGTAAASTTVNSCYNAGTLTGSAGYSGGISSYGGGTSSSSAASITNCYNTGTVSTSGARVAGLMAYLSSYAALQNCYSTGSVSTSSSSSYVYAAGAVAYTSGKTAALNNCLNNYVLTGSASAVIAYTTNYSSSNAAFADAEDLKTYASTLGSAYKNDTNGINSGYPILLWQGYAADEASALLEDLPYEENLTLDDIIDAFAIYNALSSSDQELVENAYNLILAYDILYDQVDEDTETEHEHTYDTDNPVWTWTDDYSTASVTFSCTEGDDEQTVEASVSVTTVNPTCTEDGESVYTATATFNGTDYKDTKTEAIAATGHTYSLPAFTWADDYSSVTAAFTCSVCDDVQTVTTTDITSETTAATCSETGLITYTATVTFESTEHSATTSVVLEATGHDYDDGVVTTGATCTEEGVLTYTCKNDSSHTYTETIPATGHSYALTGFTWADDYSATAIFTCANDATHTQTVEATVTSEVTTEATCTAEGVRTYTATVTYEGITGTDTATETIEKIAHSYEAVVTEPTCTEGGYTTYTCSVCGDTYTADEIEAAGHSYEAFVTEPTCTEDGYTTYTCSVCGDTYTADETEAAGHDYGNDGYCTVCGAYSAQAAADAVIALIDAIGTVTQDSGEAITAAREAYDTLLAADPEAAALVSNLDTLTAAEQAYAALTEAEDDTGDGSGDENGSTVDGDSGDENGSTGDGDTGDDGSSTGDGDSGDENGTGSDGDIGDENGSTGDGDTGEDSGSIGDGDTDDDDGTTTGFSYTVPTKKIAASKVSLTGATVAQVTQTLAKLTNDGDLADSTYYLLQAKAKKTTKKSVKLRWKKVSGATSYVVYANACGKSKKLKKYKVTSKTSLNITKIAGKKLTSGKYYKFLVIALDADGKVIQTSKVIHVATKGGSVTNAKSITLYKSGKKITSLTLKEGKSAKITAKVTKQDKKKKIKNHRKTKYESSNKKIATVNKNGKITAKSKGTCYIYAYAQNGVSKKIKVTVK